MGRSALAGAVAALAIAAPAVAADPILPLADVRPGMTGLARTVVQGTEIVTFPVTVIDVQKSSSGPGGALIFIRASGPLMDRTGGIAQGMSGSPVYVTGADGVERVMGAVAFGTGDEANRIGAVTPIEAMLRSAGGKLALSRRPVAVGPRREVVRVSSRAAARRLEQLRPGARAVYPLARWTISGASRWAAGRLKTTLARSGIRLESTGGRQTRPPTPLVPGSSITALIAGGDVVVGTIGTVTYVDGPTVLGFGHPFLSTGASRFLMGDGYVYETIPAALRNESYKLGEPGTLQGMIVGDRADGVVGRIGPVSGIPVVSRARDTRRDSMATVTTLLAPDPRTATEVTDVLQAEPAFRVRDAIDGGTLWLRIRVRSPELARPFVYENRYAANGDVINLAIGPLTRIATSLLQNGVRRVPITSIDVTQIIRPEVRAARIVGAGIRPTRVRPGQRATLRVAILPWRGTRQIIRVPFRVPDLASGPVRLRVLPGGGGGFDSSPPQLTEEVVTEETTAARSRRQLRALNRLIPAGRAPASRRVAAALTEVLGDRNDTLRILGPGEDADDPDAGATLRVPWILYAGRAAPRIVVR